MLNKLILSIMMLALTSCSALYSPRGSLINAWIKPTEINSSTAENYLEEYGDFCAAFTEDGKAYILSEDHMLWTYDWCLAEDESFRVDQTIYEFDYLGDDTWDIKVTHELYPYSVTGTMTTCDDLDRFMMPGDRKSISEMDKEHIKC